MMFRFVEFQAVAGTVFNQNRQLVGRVFHATSADDFWMIHSTGEFDNEADVPIHELKSVVQTGDADAAVILISIFDSEEDIWNAVQAGVKGDLTKKAGDVDALIEAIQRVAAGKSCFPEVIENKLKRRSEQKSFTDREMQVCWLPETVIKTSAQNWIYRCQALSSTSCTFAKN